MDALALIYYVSPVLCYPEQPLTSPYCLQPASPSLMGSFSDIKRACSAQLVLGELILPGIPSPVVMGPAALTLVSEFGSVSQFAPVMGSIEPKARTVVSHSLLPFPLSLISLSNPSLCFLTLSPKHNDALVIKGSKWPGMVAMPVIPALNCITKSCLKKSPSPQKAPLSNFPLL